MSAADWQALRATLAGTVVRPDSADYDSARAPAVPQVDDIRPEAVVRCAVPADVTETVAFARRTGVPLAVRGGGHCFAGRSSSPGVVVDVAPMHAVSVSAASVTVGGGARLGAVYDELVRHGRTLPAGCGPSVGIAGLTLGGGLGLLGRTYGLTCDSLRSAQVVLADGRVVDADAEREPELFWALRGAGNGTLGVVTALTFDTVPVPDTTAFHLVWPADTAAAVVSAWQRWAPDAPDELAASLLLTVEGNAVEAPKVNVIGAMSGSGSDTVALLDGLITHVGTDPASTAYHESDYRAAKRYFSEVVPAEAHAGHPVEGGPVFSRSEYFRRPLPAEAVAALVDHLVAARAPGQSRELDFTPWAGAYNRPRAGTAFVHRDERFLLKHADAVDAAASERARDDARQWLERSWALAHPWGSGGVYPNFPEPGLGAWSAEHVGAHRDRLLRVGRAYDPDGVFGRHR